MALISVDELAERLAMDDPFLRVVDVRWYLNRPGAGRAAYDEGHLPTAIFLDLDAELADPEGLGAPGRHPLPAPAEFARNLAARGIGSQHQVVAYDDSSGTVAARLWWMLDSLGHRAGAALLDGGSQAWVAAGHPLSRAEPRWPPAQLELADRWTNVVEREQVAAAAGTLTVLDARAPERYRGEVEPIDPQAGHIPGALSVPAAGNLAADGRLLPVDALRDRFAPIVESGKPVVVSCGSGAVACHNALAMRLAGLPDPLLYAGSFSDWSRSGLPVVAGSEPGDPA
jgi:thiosulfate/3-mercaptopyruvate sulfurtransferase